MKKSIVALTLVAASFQVAAAEEVKPEGLKKHAAPIAVTLAMTGAAIAAANAGNDDGNGNGRSPSAGTGTTGTTGTVAP